MRPSQANPDLRWHEVPGPWPVGLPVRGVLGADRFQVELDESLHRLESRAGPGQDQNRVVAQRDVAGILTEAPFGKVERGKELTSTLVPEHLLEPLASRPGGRLRLLLARRFH